MRIHPCSSPSWWTSSSRVDSQSTKWPRFMLLSRSMRRFRKPFPARPSSRLWCIEMNSDSGLRGLKVVDLGVGIAAALVTKFLREGGADITRLEPSEGDPFYAVYPAYEVWRRGSTVLRNLDRPQESLETLLASADVCLLGGEDYPGM